uniref:Hypotheticial protein n=1 Tax=Schistosoma japonicum TaxID=6182 RepID=C1LGN2_SCHJA|nr:hypotheticial protein [Schistosoma japonicum]
MIPLDKKVDEEVVKKFLSFKTTSSDYGLFAPNTHTMANYYYPLKGEFSHHLGKCGMYRNHSFNTSMDK